MPTAVLIDGQITHLDGEIAPFPVDVAATTEIFEQIQAIARQLNIGSKRSGPGWIFTTDSWTPEAEAELPARRKFRPDASSGEFISVHSCYCSPELGAELRALGLAGNDRAGYALLVQKVDWWPRDHYERKSEADQIAADRAWVDAGGWLSEEKLARAGIK
jgi:hypothetical protein